MRRKKDDKRVLRSGNGQRNNSRIRKRNNRRLVPKAPNRNFSNGPRAPKRKKKRDGKVVFLMILALVAFVIGAGVGISLSFDDGSDEGPHFVNVTKQMTSDLNNTTQVYYDPSVDDIDYNENETSKLNVNYTYSDYTYKDYQ